MQLCQLFSIFAVEINTTLPRHRRHNGGCSDATNAGSERQETAVVTWWLNGCSCLFFVLGHKDSENNDITQQNTTSMITAIEPTVSATARYSITQAAGILGISRITLRRYTDSGLIKCGFRRETARKFYLGSEILRFWKAQL